MSEVIKMIKLSKPVFDKLCQVQVKMTPALPTRPSFSDVIEKCLDAYLEGQK
jgi:hypothetical protein